MIDDSVGRVPFPGDYRASGILLHVTSLPSSDGIGDLGPTAMSWIDRLKEAGQNWWQALPLGPTGYDNSPYEPLSSFARNGLVISPQWLVEDELLAARDCEHPSFPANAVDYDAIILFKHRLFEKAWDRFRTGTRADLRSDYERFCHDQEQWLPDYALFRALKAKFGNAHHLEWPSELVQRQPAALEQARGQLSNPIGQVSFAQFLLFRQAERLRTYAQRKGLTLMGDLPFFVSGDSSDVWANPQFFLLDEQHRPRSVAGVPPDYFSSTGQLWGNPVYNWDALRQAGYRWWVARLRSLLSHVDVMVGSFSWLRGCVACAGRSTDRRDRKVGTRSRQRVFPSRRKGVGQVALCRRGLGADHSRCVFDAGSISSSRHAHPTVRFRRS